MARRDHAVLRDDGRPPAAAGRLRIVLRLRSNQRRENQRDDQPGSSTHDFLRSQAGLKACATSNCQVCATSYC